MAKAESTVRMNADPAAVMKVIADFEHYPEFLPEIRGVSVLSTADGVSTVRFDLEMLMRVSYTLLLTREGDSTLSWELSDSKLIKKNNELGQTKNSAKLVLFVFGIGPIIGIIIFLYSKGFFNSPTM